MLVEQIRVKMASTIFRIVVKKCVIYANLYFFGFQTLIFGKMPNKRKKYLRMMKRGELKLPNLNTIQPNLNSSPPYFYSAMSP
jgi:hypothetical protein